MIVLDTNIVLDLFVFSDPQTQPLKQALADRQLQWLATQPMRDELERVLAYPKIVARLRSGSLTAAGVLTQFDGQTRRVEVAPKASVTCRDADDQKFIDLAVAHKTLLLSKDSAVLCMKKRLVAYSVTVQATMSFVAKVPD